MAQGALVMPPNIPADRPHGPNRWLRFTPRILSIVLVLFLSLFALDAFDSDQPVLQQLIAFAIHLKPSFVLAITAAVAWRFPRCGGWLYLAWAAFYVFMAWGKEAWIAFVLISGPLALTGLLFILQGRAASKGQKTVQGP